LPRGNSDSRAANKFKVPQKVWGSWTLVARHVFNKTYETMMKSPDNFRHPEDQKTEINLVHWKTIAWNAAWMAASLCSRGEKYLLKDLALSVKG
jgi:hypothetical protein